MRILVTGAGGYIGRHLIPRLSWGERHEIIRLWPDHSNDSNLFGYEDGHYRANLSTVDTESMALELDDIDTVIHLAGRVDINLLPNPKGAHLPPVPGPCDIGALYRDNVLATANVLDYCLRAGVKHLIFASTQAVYGMPFHDDRGDVIIEPLEYYANSKLAAESLVVMARRQGLTVTVLLLPGVYGGDRRSGAVYSMCKSALTEGRIRFALHYPLPMNVMHIEDVVGAFVQAAGYTPEPEYHGDSVDITDDEDCSLQLIAEDVAELTGVSIEAEGIKPPVMYKGFSVRHVAPCLGGWAPKPRKERLAQVLEGIRRDP